MDFWQGRLLLSRDERQVLWSKAVHHLDALVDRFHVNEVAALFQYRFDRFVARELFALLEQFPLDLIEKFLRVGDQPDDAVAAVLGLGEQVSSDPFGVRRTVGQNQDLTWAWQEVDRDAAEQLPLRLDNESVARAKIFETGAIVFVPSAIAATAWAPPTL